MNENRRLQNLARMKELFIPIDNQIMMCDNVDDLLMLASMMMIHAKDIYVQRLGGQGAKELIMRTASDIDVRKLPLGREIPPENS